MKAMKARRIVLTGATRGLGLALARRFDERGHVVHGCGTSPERVAAAREALGPRHTVDAVDVADARATESWAAGLLAAHGAPDLLIHNAGVMHAPAPLWEIPASDVARVLAVNVGGAANLVRAFLPAMIARGRGVVLLASSGWGRSTSPGVAPYCASKFAIEGLASALAQEVPGGIVVAAFDPGIIDTDMLRIAWADEAASYPDAETWSHGAADFLLAVGPRDHGRPLSIPAP